MRVSNPISRSAHLVVRNSSVPVPSVSACWNCAGHSAPIVQQTWLVVPVQCQICQACPLWDVVAVQASQIVVYQAAVYQVVAFRVCLWVVLPPATAIKLDCFHLLCILTTPG